MKNQLKIRPLEDSEIGIAAQLIPSDWKFNFEHILKHHPDKNNYKAFAGFIEDKLVCFGDLVINQPAGWLGNIVVHPAYRTKGIGQSITMFLINYLKNHACTTILTMASEASKPRYQKLGMLTSSVYCVLNGKLLAVPPADLQIRLAEFQDTEQIYALDSVATSEDRKIFFNNSILNAWVYVSGQTGKLEGFFLPGEWEGPIVASSVRAGLELLQFKHSLSLKYAVIPCENKTAVDFMKKNHFHETGMLYRMVLGEDLDWIPEMIYSRACRFGS